VTRRHFQASSLAALEEHGFLTHEEFEALCQGQRFLWRIRYGLHNLARRREDRLLIEHQRALAERFGYQCEGGKLAVEHFMRDYYRTITELGRLNEMLLQLYEEEFLQPEAANSPPQMINRRFQSRHGYLEVIHPNIFRRYPFALLELFLLLTQHSELIGVRANTVRLIRSHRHLIDERFRQDIRNRALFMELLRQPHGVTHALRRMNRYGILAAYLPVFGHIVGQMQHDLFHVYTVDEHTLFVLRNLRRLTVNRFSEEHPLASQIMRRLPKPELLYIAALFHDIAKGRGGDHSELGAIDVEAFCRHHLLSDYDTQLVTWLVANHLLMSSTAQRQDISDPEVIHRFASRVGYQNRLDYLYLLTQADMRATSPTVWNSWKAALLADLYQRTRRAFRRGLANPIGERELIDEHKQEARRLLADHYRLIGSRIDRLWQQWGDDYFLRYIPGEIAWHTHGILTHAEEGEPILLIRRSGDRGGTEIFIYAVDSPLQFATTTAVLDQLALTIADARIINALNGHTLDSYIVLEENGDPIASDFRLQEIESALRGALIHPDRPILRCQRHINRQLRQFPRPTQVTFQQHPTQPRTLIEVSACDRPGLLACIATALGQQQVRLENARIATYGERVEDIFLVTDADGGAITDPEQQQAISQAIIAAVEAG
jgi:[protein-PII] uridylyltransferase